MSKSSTIAIIAIFAAAFNAGRIGQTVKSNIDQKADSISMKLAAKYENNMLQDISIDGKQLLFFSTKRWIRLYTFPLDGKPPFSNQPESSSDDMLRIVDFANGKEVARAPTGRETIFLAIQPDTFASFSFSGANLDSSGIFEKFWKIEPAQISRCFDVNKIELGPGEGGLSHQLTLTSKSTALGHIWLRKLGDILVAISLPDCKVTRVGPVSPSDSDVQLIDAHVSPSMQHVAISTRRQKIVIRDAKTLEFVKEILTPTGLWLGEQIDYTPDGKYLFAIASNSISDNRDTRRYLLFFDSKNYELIKKLDITKWQPPILSDELNYPSDYIGTAMAISPDSRLMAVGFTREEKKLLWTMERAEIIVFDLSSGDEVARASHPAKKQKRDDPYASKINKLAFTPDGKYLLSSTHDTLVWELRN